MKFLAFFTILLCLLTIWYYAFKICDPTLTAEKFWGSLAKMFIDIFKPTPQVAPNNVNINQFYEIQRMNYTSFAESVSECIKDMNRKFNLSFCSEPRNIFAPSVVDRVKDNPNGIAFLYETKMDAPLFGTRHSVPTSTLQTFFQNNLMSVVANGYYFTGPVYVIAVDSNKITIEVQGVNRIYPTGGDNGYGHY